MKLNNQTNPMREASFLAKVRGIEAHSWSAPSWAVKYSEALPVRGMGEGDLDSLRGLIQSYRDEGYIGLFSAVVIMRKSVLFASQKLVLVER